MSSPSIRNEGVAENIDSENLTFINNHFGENLISESPGNASEGELSSTSAGNASEGGMSTLAGSTPEKGMSSTLTGNNLEKGIASTLGINDPDIKIDSTRTEDKSGEDSSDTLSDSSSTDIDSDWESYSSRTENDPGKGMPSTPAGKLPEDGMASTLVGNSPERGMASSSWVVINHHETDSPRAEKDSEESSDIISLGYSSSGPNRESLISCSEYDPKERTIPAMAKRASIKSTLSRAPQQLKEEHDIFVNKLFDLLFTRAIEPRNPCVHLREKEFLDTVALAVRTIAYLNRASYSKKYRRWKIEGLPENRECVKRCALKHTVSKDKYYFISFLKWIAYLFDLFMYCLKENYDYIHMGIDIIANNTDLEYFQEAGGNHKLYGIARKIYKRCSRHLPYLNTMKSPMDETIHPILIQLDVIASIESKVEAMFPPEDLLKIKAVRDGLSEKITILFKENRNTIAGRYRVIKKEKLLKKCLENEASVVLVPLLTDNSPYEKGAKVSIEVEYAPDLLSDSEDKSLETKLSSDVSTNIYVNCTVEKLDEIDIACLLKRDSLCAESEQLQTDNTELASLTADGNCQDEQGAASACVQDNTVLSHSTDEFPEMEDLRKLAPAFVSNSARDEAIAKYRPLFMDTLDNFNLFKRRGLRTENEQSQTDTTEPGSLSPASLPADGSYKDEQTEASACVQDNAVPSHSADFLPEMKDLGAFACTTHGARDEITFKCRTLYMDNSNNAAEAEYDLKFLRHELDQKQQPAQLQSIRKRPKKCKKKK